MKNAVIVYCSPGGSTRHVGNVIGSELQKNDVDVFTVDLGLGIDDTQNVIDRLLKEKSCLFIGSPVYANRAIPPVMQLIDSLPDSTAICAVPFVTWGGAGSGIALHDLGTALAGKGYRLLGGGKVLALHTMMWQYDNPLGQNHPDQNDDEMIAGLVQDVVHKMRNDETPAPISLGRLAYQPEKLHMALSEVTFEQAKAHMPKKEIDESVCTQCGQCAEYCPVQAITLSPYPAFNDNCIFCFKCMRDCPENAFTTSFGMLESKIREKAEKLKEQPLSEVFV